MCEHGVIVHSFHSVCVSVSVLLWYRICHQTCCGLTVDCIPVRGDGANNASGLREVQLFNVILFAWIGSDVAYPETPARIINAKKKVAL